MSNNPAQQSAGNRSSITARLECGVLEDRLAPAVFTVTTAADSGAGSLRDAIKHADATPGADVIRFHLPSGDTTIHLASALPSITNAVTIDGTSEPGFAGTPLVTIDGAGAGVTASGLVFSAGKSTVTGVVVTDFGGNGIGIIGTAQVTVQGCYVGVDPSTSAEAGNSGDGILIRTANNTIGGVGAGKGNVIGGNKQGGVVITGTGATKNTVQGNYIGTGVGGHGELSNDVAGVLVSAGASNNTIGVAVTVGGDLAAAVLKGANDIANNKGDGVRVVGTAGARPLTSGNTITGNIITENAEQGIQVSNAANTKIGGENTLTKFAGNIIAENGRDGVLVVGVSSASVSITGNTISGNHLDGVTVIATTGTTIGGRVGGSVNSGNTITDNGRVGIRLVGTHKANVFGNNVGVTASGLGVAGNGGDGILITGGATDTTVGGGTYIDTKTGGVFSKANVVSGNGESIFVGAGGKNGIEITGTGTTRTNVFGNFIGTDRSGTVKIANNGDGIKISGGASRTVIGGAGNKANVISGNDDDGVAVVGDIGTRGTTGTTIAGNKIGTDVSGRFALSNKGNGVSIEAVTGAGASDTVIGSGNLIAGNGGDGVKVSGAAAKNTTIMGNQIGTTADTPLLAGNGGDGVSVGEGATGTTVRGNVVGGNVGDGVKVEGKGTDRTTISGNIIGLSADGASPAGNLGNGVSVGEGATNTTITNGNVISGNTEYGVKVSGAGTSNTTITGNEIGTTSAGTAAAANQSGGILIQDGAVRTTVGGTATGAGNLISGNGGSTTADGNGIKVEGKDTTGVKITNNIIGLDVTGKFAIPNAGSGVDLDGVVGATVSGNTISGNGQDGVRIEGADATGNTVSGNLIGTDATGNTGVGNQGNGVKIENGASKNTIGKNNVISANAQNGILIESANTSQNTVTGNLVGLNKAGIFAIGNSGDGVAVTEATTTTLTNNFIGGNVGNGVRIEGGDGTVLTGNYVGLNKAGNVGIGNHKDGILVTGTKGTVMIGKLGAAKNVVSGNAVNGIEVLNSPRTVIQNSQVGTSADGLRPIPNGAAGIRIAAAAGAAPAALISAAATDPTTVQIIGNEIAGNTGAGVLVDGSTTTGVVIQGNSIGTTMDGLTAIGNGGAGVLFTGGASANLVGGDTASQANTIANNGGAGVQVDTGGTNSILSNSIYANTAIGILLTNGGNNGIAPPVLTSAQLQNGVVTLAGSAPTNGTYRLQVFANGSDSSMSGRQLILDTMVSGSFSLSLSGLANGVFLTATLTDAAGNTSQFAGVQVSQGQQEDLSVYLPQFPPSISVSISASSPLQIVALTQVSATGQPLTYTFDVTMPNNNVQFSQQGGFFDAAFVPGPSSPQPTVTIVVTVTDGVSSATETVSFDVFITD